MEGAVSKVRRILGILFMIFLVFLFWPASEEKMNEKVRSMFPESHELARYGQSRMQTYVLCDHGVIHFVFTDRSSFNSATIMGLTWIDPQKAACR